MKTGSMRLGIVSFAHMHAHSYAACLNALPDVTLVGVHDADEPRGRQAAERYGTDFFEELEPLLNQSLDGVIVCTENIHHRAFVEACAERVKHILCEKPIATTLEDARAMMSACERHGVKLQIALPVRFAPPVQQLKTLLHKNALGTVFSASCTNHGRLPGGWFTDPKQAGGGAVMDHTVHVVDLLRWLFNTEVSEVYAEIGYGLLHPGLGTDDAGMLSFTLKNGTYGTLDTSWSRPPNHPIWGDVKLELTGEKGSAHLDVFRQHLTLTSTKEGTQYLGWGSNPDMGLVQDFLTMIGTGGEPSITGEDGLRALEVTLAAYHSAETGEVVQLEYER